MQSGVASILHKESGVCAHTENSAIAVIRKSRRQNRKVKSISEYFWS
ncbi:MAG: hypothetical protein HGB06_02355 [Chlorobaculum sp.]|nr:hypothetical protein [Chlorobaculum sp.]